MTKALKDLQRDHANFMKLLIILEQELAVFDQGERPDYEVIETIVAYFSDYAADFHHPLENAIYGRLKARDPKAAKAVGDLDAEHRKNSAEVAAFADATGAVLQEREIPREVFHQKAMRFIEQERAHIGMEERLFFPKAQECLTAEDWSAVEAGRSPGVDPLFSDQKKSEYLDLAERIAAWESEAQQQRSGSHG